MKALIWIVCVICASIVQVLLKYAGIGGAIPAMLVFGGMYGSARALCKKYDERKARKTAEKAAHSNANTVPAPHIQGSSGQAKECARPPIAFCRKCGNKLIEGSEFCSSCGTAVIKG